MSIDGLYEIIEMELWGKDAIDLGEPARISIQGKKGKLNFISYDCQMDIRKTKDRYLFTWAGNNECDFASGYGNFTSIGDTLTGRIYIHDSYDSSFVAIKATQEKKKVKIINKALLIIKAKEPFIEWIDSLQGKEKIAIRDINNGCTAYLLPAFDGDLQRDGILNKVYANIFVKQLSYWCIEDVKWPRNRTLTLFFRWFELEFHSIVEDLVE